MTDGTTKPAGTRRNAAGCVLLILIVGGVGVGISQCSGKPPTPDRYDAQSVCEQFVKEQLKSPGSAKFSGKDTTNSGGQWTVTGTVDSQNSFGGLVRNTFTCVTKPPESGGSQWRLVSLTGLTN